MGVCAEGTIVGADIELGTGLSVPVSDGAGTGVDVEPKVVSAEVEDVGVGAAGNALPIHGISVNSLPPLAALQHPAITLCLLMVCVYTRFLVGLVMGSASKG